MTGKAEEAWWVGGTGEAGAATEAEETREAGREGWEAVDPGAGCEELAALARSELAGRFGVDVRVVDRLRWRLRGGRLWSHTLSEWPAWLGEDASRAARSGGVRLAAAGFRAVEFDSRGRPRPTNDLLRRLDSEITERVVDVGADELRELLRGGRLPGPSALGPHALRLVGDVVGRAAATRAGLVSEIGRARGRDLLRTLERSRGLG